MAQMVAPGTDNWPCDTAVIIGTDEAGKGDYFGPLVCAACLSGCENLNSLVAWEHARAIQDLLSRGVRAEYAVIDKFADERYLYERLRKDSRRGGIRLEHRTKAESDVAVAAASILARDRFVGWLAKASSTLGTTLPKGAGPQVITTACALVAARGPDILRGYAKVSFKTSRAVLENTS